MSIEQYINVIRSYSMKNSEQEEGVLQHFKKTFHKEILFNNHFFFGNKLFLGTKSSGGHLLAEKDKEKYVSCFLSCS